MRVKTHAVSEVVKQEESFILIRNSSTDEEF